MVSKRRGVIERIWSTGILQAVAPDVAGALGIAAIGVGIWQFSRPATWIYAGAVLIVASVLVSIDRARAAAAAKKASHQP